MAADSPDVSESNREFIETYLDIGIGHQYTLAKLLSSRITGELSEPEMLSVGLEVSALAGSALDNLVRWYNALRKWRTRHSQTLLIDAIEELEMRDSLRLNALSHIGGTRTDEFCHAFGIPWRSESLRERRIDIANWRFTVDRARLNRSKVRQDLAPVTALSSRDRVIGYLSGIGQGPLASNDEYRTAPAVWTTSLADNSPDEQG